MDDAATPEAAGRGDAGHGARRALLTGGALAALAAGGALGAPPAEAAAGGAMRLGRSNSAGSGATTLQARSSASGFRVYQRGSGMGLHAEAESHHGLSGLTESQDSFGVLARNTGDRAGTGAALRAQGRRNPGLVADTDAQVRDVPAVAATGGDGSGVALLARGESYLDGDVLALRSWIGVLDPGGRLTYAPVVSAEQASHSAFGTVALDASGAAVVTLGADFEAAADMSTLAVCLTPNGVSMPDLYVSTSSTGFAVAGGVPGGKVCWVARAARLVLDVPSQGQAVSPQVTHGRRSRRLPGWKGY